MLPVREKTKQQFNHAIGFFAFCCARNWLFAAQKKRRKIVCNIRIIECPQRRLWSFSVPLHAKKVRRGVLISLLFFPAFLLLYGGVKSKSSKTPKSKPKRKPKALGNYIDRFVKQMFGRVVVFIDFLVNYADAAFVAEIDVKKTQLAPTHYFGLKGDERIVDLVFQCPLKTGNGSLMAVIIFEAQNENLSEIPEKLLRYVSAIWDAERKAGKPLSAPYFIVVRTGKKPYRGKVYPKMSDSLPKRRDGKPIGKAVDIEYDVVDLPKWDFGDLIGGTVLRLALGMLHKMTGDAIEEYPKALLPLLEIDDVGERIELSKELAQFVVTAFAAHNRRVDEAALGKALHPVLKGKEKAMIKTIFDEKYDAGVADGEARGEARGEDKGKAESVLTVLRNRFKRIPKNVEKAVTSMSDSIALESLLEHAVHSDTMEEFAETLR
jgi:hypothetical protein